MAPRQSSRLRSVPDRKSSDNAQDAPTEPEKSTEGKQSTRRKAATAKPAGSTNAAKRATKAGNKSTTATAIVSSPQGPDQLSSLSPEILCMIADNITNQAAINALSQTSKTFCNLMMPRLYHRIVTAALFHAHIANLIRNLEPHLTIKQKKQLKKEGKYRGQQESYSRNLDSDKVPLCASYVRQLTFGHSDPGKKHMYIVYRYLEEALKNWTNLEIVETMVVNESICESIASLAGLKALNIYAISRGHNDDLAPLARIENLKHLNLQVADAVFPTLQSIIRNSMSTLRSLHVTSNTSYTNCFQHLAKNLEITSINGSAKFSELKSLHLESMLVDEEFIEFLSKAVEFRRLRDLGFKHLADRQNLLYPFLTSLMTSHKHSDKPLGLRTLFVDMDNPHWPPLDADAKQALLEAKCTFIASFDTLTALTLQDYGQYNSQQITINPGIPDTLLQALLKHKNLKELKMSYVGVVSGVKIPWVEPRTIAGIVDGLPELTELQFAPDDSRMDEIGLALSRGRNLKTITCYPYEGWTTYPNPDADGTKMIGSILSAFLRNAEDVIDPITGNNKPFIWEDHYSLTRVVLAGMVFGITSTKPKQPRGVQLKPEKLQVNVNNNGNDQIREVWYYHVPPRAFRQIGYDDEYTWIKQVEKDI